MDKRRFTLVIIIAVMLLSALASPLSAERVVSSQTLQLYGYIPERTTVSVTSSGSVLLESNNPSAILDVIEYAGATILSVKAR